MSNIYDSKDFEVLSREHYMEMQDEIEFLCSEIERLRDVLLRAGFVTCDAPACNCGSWHHRYGLRERMDELRDALAEAGHPLCNENGNLPLNALQDLIDERDRLREELKAAQKDVYCDYSLEAALDRMAEDERKLGMALDQEKRDE